MRLVKYFSALGLIFFGYIVYSIGPGKILEIISTIDPLYVAFAIILTLITFVFKSLRWKRIIAFYDTDYPLMKCYRGFLVGIFFGQLTPGRIGDFMRAFYLREEGLSFGKSMSTVVIDRLFDIIGIAIMATFGIIFLAGEYVGIGSFKAVLAAFALLIALIVFFSHEHITRKMLLPLFNVIIPQKYRSHAIDGFNEFYRGVNMLLGHKLQAVYLLALTIVGWFLTFSSTYLLAVALNIPVPFLFFTSVIPVITLVTLVPISISGLGTREAAMIFFFGLVGVSAGHAVALSLTTLVFISLSFALAGAVLWTRNPADITFKSG